MEQKIKRIVLCLYAVGALKLISMIYFMIVRVQALQSLPQYDLTLSSTHLFGIDLILDVFILILLFNEIKDLKRQKASAWAFAVVICVVTAPSLALPASIYGLILLFDEEIRGPFIKKLEDKINF